MRLAPYYQYDKVEDYFMPDGGHVTLSFRGKFDGTNKRPVIFYCGGQATHNQYGVLRNMLDHLYRGDPEGGPGFDVVFLGYRGLGIDSKGELVRLKTPRFYTVLSGDDCVKPFKYVYEKYCKPYGRRVFGLGNSFGSNLMTMAFHRLDFIECFCFCSAIVDMPKTQDHIEVNMFGKMSEVFAEDLF